MTAPVFIKLNHNFEPPGVTIDYKPFDGATEFVPRDLAQASVAAAYEAAASADGWEAYVADTSPQYLSDWQRGLVAGQQAMRKAIRALASPDQIAAQAAEQAKLDKAVEALQGLVRYQKSILADVLTAHNTRGAGASEWMREDDRDFMRDLRAAFDVSAAVLTEIGGA